VVLVLGPAWSLRLGCCLILGAGLCAYALNDLHFLILTRIVVAGGVALVSTSLLLHAYATNNAKLRSADINRQAAMNAASAILVPILASLLALQGWKNAFFAYLLLVPIVLMTWRTEAATLHPTQTTVETPAFIPWRGLLVVFSLALSGSTLLYVIPLRITLHIHGLGYESQIYAALLSAVPSAFALLFPLLSISRNRQHSEAMQLISAFALMGAALIMTSVSLAIIPVYGALAVFGLGYGLFLPSFLLLARKLLGETDRSFTAAATTSLLFGSQFIGAMLISLISSWMGVEASIALFGMVGLLMSLVCAVAFASQLRSAIIPLEVGDGISMRVGQKP
jgi:hypothetical protein